MEAPAAAAAPVPSGAHAKLCNPVAYLKGCGAFETGNEQQQQHLDLDSQYFQARRAEMKRDDKKDARQALDDAIREYNDFVDTKEMRIAVVGPAGVGKSALVNQLLGMGRTTLPSGKSDSAMTLWPIELSYDSAWSMKVVYAPEIPDSPTHDMVVFEDVKSAEAVERELARLTNEQKDSATRLHRYELDYANYMTKMNEIERAGEKPAKRSRTTAAASPKKKKKTPVAPIKPTPPPKRTAIRQVIVTAPVEELRNFVVVDVPGPANDPSIEEGIRKELVQAHAALVVGARIPDSSHANMLVAWGAMCSSFIGASFHTSAQDAPEMEARFRSAFSEQLFAGGNMPTASTPEQLCRLIMPKYATINREVPELQPLYGFVRSAHIDALLRWVLICAEHHSNSFPAELSQRVESKRWDIENAIRRAAYESFSDRLSLACPSSRYRGSPEERNAGCARDLAEYICGARLNWVLSEFTKHLLPDVFDDKGKLDTEAYLLRQRLVRAIITNMARNPSTSLKRKTEEKAILAQINDLWTQKMHSKIVGYRNDRRYAGFVPEETELISGLNMFLLKHYAERTRESVARCLPYNGIVVTDRK